MPTFTNTGNITNTNCFFIAHGELPQTPLRNHSVMWLVASGGTSWESGSWESASN